MNNIPKKVQYPVLFNVMFLSFTALLFEIVLFFELKILVTDNQRIAKE